MSGLQNKNYKIDSPAVISFSGGATSGYMLHRIIQHFGGKLPENVVPVFANTGLEHPKTYDFIEECEINWGIKIYWVEFTGGKGFKEVDYCTASRSGEPFDLLISQRQFLPNPIARFCTSELKVQTMLRWSNNYFGMSNFSEAIGLRFDEPRRVSKIRADMRGRDIVFPIYDARETILDVDAFWKNNNFRLGISRAFGNCVGCFLKGASTLSFVAESEPEHLEWWAKKEESPIGFNDNGIAKMGKFRSDRPSYRGLIQMAQNQQSFNFPDDDNLPCACTD